MQPTPTNKSSILVSIPQYLIDKSSKNNNGNNSNSVTVATSTTTNSSSFSNEKSFNVFSQNKTQPSENNANIDKANAYVPESSSSNLYNMYSTLEQFKVEGNKKNDDEMDESDNIQQENRHTSANENYAVANYLLKHSYYTSTVGNNFLNALNNEASFNYNSPNCIRTSAKKHFPQRSHIILPIPTAKQHITPRHNNYHFGTLKAYPDVNENAYVRHNSMVNHEDDLNEKVQLVQNFYNLDT